MIATVYLSVTSTYVWSDVFSCIAVNVSCKAFILIAGRAPEPAFNAAVRL